MPSTKILERVDFVAFLDERGHLIRVRKETSGKNRRWILQADNEPFNRTSVYPSDAVFAIIQTQDGYIGFRSVFAEGKVLQASKDSTIQLDNHNFGTWEQWSLSDPSTSQSLTKCELTNRQFPKVKLVVELRRLLTAELPTPDVDDAFTTLQKVQVPRRRFYRPWTSRPSAALTQQAATLDAKVQALERELALTKEVNAMRLKEMAAQAKSDVQKIRLEAEVSLEKALEEAERAKQRMEDADKKLEEANALSMRSQQAIDEANVEVARHKAAMEQAQQSATERIAVAEEAINAAFRREENAREGMAEASRAKEAAETLQKDLQKTIDEAVAKALEEEREAAALQMREKEAELRAQLDAAKAQYETKLKTGSPSPKLPPLRLRPSSGETSSSLDAMRSSSLNSDSGRSVSMNSNGDTGGGRASISSSPRGWFSNLGSVPSSPRIPSSPRTPSGTSPPTRTLSEKEKADAAKQITDLAYKPPSPSSALKGMGGRSFKM